MRVAIAGGTGFVGSYIVDALLSAGHDVTLLVRPGSESRAHRRDECRLVSGAVSQESVLTKLVSGCDAAIYNIGILRESPRDGITFEELQHCGAVRMIDAARAANVSRFLLMSANGVEQAATPYQATKLHAENALRKSGLDYTIIRPSVVFGDPRGRMEFATQLCNDMIRPPLPGVAFHTGLVPRNGEVLMSPVHVSDVAETFRNALENDDLKGRTVELGGAETLSWKDMLKIIASVAGKQKLILPMPIAVMKTAAAVFDSMAWFPVTRDQLTMLASGNIAAPAELEELIGRPAKAFSAENLQYLVR